MVSDWMLQGAGNGVDMLGLIMTFILELQPWSVARAIHDSVQCRVRFMVEGSEVKNPQLLRMHAMPSALMRICTPFHLLHTQGPVTGIVTKLANMSLAMQMNVPLAKSADVSCYRSSMAGKALRCAPLGRTTSTRSSVVVQAKKGINLKPPRNPAKVFSATLLYTPLVYTLLLIYKRSTGLTSAMSWSFIRYRS